jgi:putative ABC transport system substrate-binding protein
MTRVGIVTIQPRTAQIFATFGQRLRELGYVEGQNLVLDFLNPEQQPGGNAGVIEEFLRRKVDVILVPYESTLKAALATKAAVPIVMIAIDYDPLAHGYVKSLAQPGGNVTGLYLQQLDLARKRVELMTPCQARKPRPYSGTPSRKTNGRRQAKPLRRLDCGLPMWNCATNPTITMRH